MSELPIQTLDVEAADPWWRLRAGWFYAAVLAGEIHDHDSGSEGPYALLREEVGTLSLPDGRVVAADPYVMAKDALAFERRLPAGEATVVAVRAVVGEDHERVAALILVTGARPVTQWEVATVPGQDVAALEGEGFFGYGVDAGTGSFGSPEAMQVASRVLDADEGMLEDPISAALFADDLGTRSAVVVAPEPGAMPIAACSSGWGDGYYPTWLGLGADGDVVIAVTDFLVAGDPHATSIEPPQEADATPAAPPAAASGDRPRSLLRRIFGG